MPSVCDGHYAGFCRDGGNRSEPKENRRQEMGLAHIVFRIAAAVRHDTTIIEPIYSAANAQPAYQLNWWRSRSSGDRCRNGVVIPGGCEA